MSLIVRTEQECDFCHKTLPDYIYEVPANCQPANIQNWFWVGRHYSCPECAFQAAELLKALAAKERLL